MAPVALALLASLLLPFAASAEAFDYQKLNGLFAFEWMRLRERDRCAKVDTRRIRDFASKGYVCDAPSDGASSSSGRTIRFKCKSKDQKREYLIFATQADCNEEIETQKANGE
jgi:hypothetical protein